MFQGDDIEEEKEPTGRSLPIKPAVPLDVDAMVIPTHTKGGGGGNQMTEFPDDYEQQNQ